MEHRPDNVGEEQVRCRDFALFDRACRLANLEASTPQPILDRRCGPWAPAQAPAARERVRQRGILDRRLQCSYVQLGRPGCWPERSRLEPSLQQRDTVRRRSERLVRCRQSDHLHRGLFRPQDPLARRDRELSLPDPPDAVPTAQLLGSLQPEVSAVGGADALTVRRGLRQAVDRSDGQRWLHDPQFAPRQLSHEPLW